MKVLSLFDGISCGMAALERAGIPVERYVAYEIEPNAIKISQKNYPAIEHCGDVTTADFTQYQGFDLLIGGSPCQDLSVAKIGGKGLSGEKSGLFYQYLRALKECRPKYFLLENVASMKNSDRDAITELLGVEPVAINSNLVSALERNRYYWTNIPGISQPEDKGLHFADVMESDVDERFYFSEKTYESMNKIVQRSKERGLGFRTGIIESPDSEKFKNLDANYHKGCDGKRSMVRAADGRLRMATPTEAERLQTLPDGYTEGISNTRRYMCRGNGWTVDVIAHILKGLAPEQERKNLVNLVHEAIANWEHGDICERIADHLIANGVTVQMGSGAL